MVGRGEFPAPDAPTGPRRGAPRVGDGLVRLNSEGEVLYASPNALSCFHRLGVVGDLVGRSLVEVTAELIEQHDTVDESMPLVLMGRAPWRVDVEARGVALSLRAVPLTEHGQRVGAVLLCRDVSELRRRERELITKDATIREIHHRVKNNLQTVAALLRLQSRRCRLPGGQGGARGGDAAGADHRARARDPLADARRERAVRRPRRAQPAARGGRRHGGRARPDHRCAARSGRSRPRTRPRSR